MPYKDPEKQKEYLRRHYAENKDKYVDSAYASREKRKAVLQEAKNKPCADCGVQYPYYVMDFDHIEDKSFQISQAGASQKYGSFENLLAEVAKCEVVCANCHRERTHKKKQCYTKKKKNGV